MTDEFIIVSLIESNYIHYLVEPEDQHLFDGLETDDLVWPHIPHETFRCRRLIPKGGGNGDKVDVVWPDIQKREMEEVIRIERRKPFKYHSHGKTVRVRKGR